MIQPTNSIFTNTKWQIVIIAATILLLYFRTFSYEFIGLDEQSLLEDKRSFNREISNILHAFKQHVFEIEGRGSSAGSSKYYRPMLTVSFILDEQFSKGGFSVYRLTNLLIHFFSAIGLLFVLLRLKVPQPLAFFLALLFTVHPLLTQAVAWIPGRNDSLVSAFILWSFYFLAFPVPPEEGSRRTFLHILFFALALFTKENAVVFVVLCAFYIFIIQPKNFNQKNKFILFVSYAGILIIWFLARNSAVGSGSLAMDGAKEGALPLLFQYFQKTILPLNLSVMSTVSDTNYGWVLLAAGIFGAAIYFTKNIPWKVIGFGMGWFVLFFLPTLLFSYFEGMEHRSYLPMVGLLIAFAHTEPLLDLARDLKKLTLIFGSGILIFAAITFMRIPVFAGELSYWENAFSTSQNSAIVCRDYGVILTKTGEYEKAEKAYLEGIKRDPKAILIHYNLGVLYFKAKQFERAEFQLQQELLLDSTSNPMTYHVLGIIYKQTGRKEPAVSMWKKAIMISPGFQPAMEELKTAKFE